LAAPIYRDCISFTEKAKKIIKEDVDPSFDTTNFGRVQASLQE
jgi:hypothetical protein